jgi:para-aminobenzoate synthetase component 1
LANGQDIIVKKGMLNWAKQFSIFLYLDNNNYKLEHGRYECLLAVGATSILRPELGHLQDIEQYYKVNNDWLFGHICYDYKNEIEKKLISRHKPKTDFPLFSFFCPETVCSLDKEKKMLKIETIIESPGNIYEAIIKSAEQREEVEPTKLQFSKKINKEDYLKTIKKLRKHIAEGDCYEINFCNEGYCNNVQIDPAFVFKKLNTLSPAPFAAYYRLDDRYMMCSSPERYLLKNGEQIISQPIKGTAKRNIDTEIDKELKIALQKNIKERAENLMIVDLVRSDLARSCEVGTVKVEELFGVYTFPQVHQMISTISGKLRNEVNFSDAIKYSFPMGSMTGAPKIKVMELIDKYEASRRELFSGTVGYISPNRDFDFNVVIRSLFYNAETRYLSYQTGGAITFDSVPENEWEEMELKAWALEKIFNQRINPHLD